MDKALSPLLVLSNDVGIDAASRLFTGWIELKGDRRFADDCAIVAGLASYRGRSVVVVGHQKGRGTKENLKRNFGMPNPEGYRKAIRLYELADKFGLPVLTFIDTPGAYPGIGAEERGQSEAIGAALAAMARARVPIIATIIGEGGSGGALALGVANSVLVLEFGCYSVISPEGCAAILWNDGSRAEEAARQLKITAPELHHLGVVVRRLQQGFKVRTFGGANPIRNVIQPVVAPSSSASGGGVGAGSLLTGAG